MTRAGEQLLFHFHFCKVHWLGRHRFKTTGCWSLYFSKVLTFNDVCKCLTDAPVFCQCTGCACRAYFCKATCGGRHHQDKATIRDVWANTYSRHLNVNALSLQCMCVFVWERIGVFAVCLVIKKREKKNSEKCMHSSLQLPVVSLRVNTKISSRLLWKTEVFSPHAVMWRCVS